MNIQPFTPISQQQQMQGYFTPLMQQQMQQPNQQMYQPMLQQQNLSNGKVVDSIEMVKFTDIPMDGNSYLFPKADGTEIYTKRWLSNGQTEINTYAKVDVNAIEENKNSFENTLMDKLNSIDERIGKLEKGLTTKSTRNNSKEE